MSGGRPAGDDEPRASLGCLDAAVVCVITVCVLTWFVGCDLMGAYWQPRQVNKRIGPPARN